MQARGPSENSSRVISMSKITLCMLAPEFLPVWGGTGAYAVELVKFLPRNVEIHVVTLRREIPGMSGITPETSDVNSIIQRPIEIHYLSASKETFFYNLPFQIACLRNIPLLHKKHEFDIIHTSLSHMPDVFLQLFTSIGIPTVLTVHATIQLLREYALRARSLFGDLELSEKSLLHFYPIVKFLQQRYVKHIRRFIAVSEIDKQIAMKDLNIESSDIGVVYNGVDTELLCPPTKNELETRYSRPTVVFVGRMIAKKGLPVLLQAMPKVLQHFPQALFLFVGGGNISSYRRTIEEMGIPRRNFSFLGHIGYSERPGILREATVFVNPSVFELCSISILEAMSCGTAVVASNVGGNPELIESGENGVLIPPLNHKILASSIISLLKDENFNKKIGREARRTVERSFSSEKCAANTFDVYKKIL